MGFFERFLGVFFSPKRTLEAVAEKPAWVAVFVVLLVALAAHTYITTPIVQRDTLSAFRDNVKMQERMGKDRFEQYMKTLENPSPARRLVTSFATTPAMSAVGFLIASLFLLIFGRIGSTTGKFNQVWGVFLHASLVDKVLGNGVRLVSILAKKSVLQTSTSLAMLFPKLSFTSPSYILLSQVDLFQLWMFGILGFGLAAIFKISLKKALVISYSFWLLKSLVYIALGFLMRSFMG